MFNFAKKPFNTVRGFSSVLSIVLNPTTTGFTDRVEVRSLNEFFHSNAWLGACTAMFGAIGGQIVALIADRYITLLFQIFNFNIP